MLEGNLLVRASAGTGKTFALATRYLRLMLLDNVDPAKIVALTFSRAAAQEIYTKILERLWKASASEEGAARESKEMGYGRSWDKAKFASLLRGLLDTQHLGTIATLDSFILRMVRNFPLEMGFQHAVEVLDAAGEGEAIQDALRVILQGTEKAEDFIQVLAAARDGNLPRVLEYRIAEMLGTWRKFYERHPDCRTWTVASMLAALGIPEKSECPDLSILNTEGSGNPAPKFMEWVRSYDGSDNIFTNGKPGEMMRFFVRNPRATVFSWTTDSGKLRRFDYGADGAEAIRGAMRHMFNLRVQRLLKQVKAKIAFVGFVEDVYNGNSRRKGKLTFSDFTRLSAVKEGSEEAFRLENLEYRFDEKFDHWALDEFQDTSELQWSCLRDLIHAAATSGGGRTVMTVGDLKQSIYTWRGGNDGPFKEMMSWHAFTDRQFGKIDDFSTSYRYEKNICDFINAVFGAENLRQGGVLPRERITSIEERWLSADCWKRHEPENRNGCPKAGDYVKVLGVSHPEGKANMEALLPAVVEEVKRIWPAHEAGGSTESVGILVRTNDDGNAIAERLRAEGIPVVWEGMSAVSDVPVVNALVDLLRLSEHPEDTFAWTVVSRLFPICSTLFRRKPGDECAAAYVSRAVAARLSHQGLSRTLQEYCRALSADSAGLDDLSKQRLREMVGVAVAYEQRNASRFSIDGFAAFLAASSKREQGTSSGVVRILTIHRSKGLTLDRVVVPIAEGTTKGLADPGRQGLLYAAEGNWVLPHLSADEVVLNGETKRAQDEMADESLLSNIRTYYVALTRARRAMYVITPLVARDAAKPFFRDIISSAVADFPRRQMDNGCAIVFEQGAEPAFKEPGASAAGNVARPARRPWCPDKPAETVERVSPSSSGHLGFAEPASALFSENAGEAAKRGVEIHGQYEAIEWADEKELSALPPAFRAAFARPSPEATVWREKSYEIYRPRGDKGEWETGQFDRVVFTGEGAARAAVVYDFKTNALRDGESAEAFERRMCRTYAPQMDAYRAALGTLTGLPAGRIRTVLLLQSTGSAVACGVRAAADRRENG